MEKESSYSWFRQNNLLWVFDILNTVRETPLWFCGATEVLSYYCWKDQTNNY